MTADTFVTFTSVLLMFSASAIPNPKLCLKSSNPLESEGKKATAIFYGKKCMKKCMIRKIVN